MSYEENKMSDVIDRGLYKQQMLFEHGVQMSLDFAEWIDIEGIRADRHEWTYKGDNYVKKYTTSEMFDLWQKELESKKK